ncbi:hypothetical protein WIS52_06560 [Pseudonocardia nematodicida]|uniref:Uncharacterized protein n=1 Tax=Pseudonocardia nematodicida TaxID=1206997 RepID=A0ABV1K8D7_9PSEU
MDDRAEERLRGEIAGLRARVEDLPENHEVGQLTRKVDAVTRDLEATTETLDALRIRTDELDDDLADGLRDIRDEHTRALDSIRRQMQHLERHIRSSAGAVAAELVTSPELRDLAERAERGKGLESQQLGPAGRATRQRTVQAWTDWQDRRDQTRQKILAASRRIAETSPLASDRRGALHSYRTAHSELAELQDRRDRTRAAADIARSELDDDADQADRASADIMRGQQAETALRAELRTQLVDAIERGHLLPVWFTTVLGLGPPADGEHWLQTGVELLAYRVTHAITDPVVALGAAPGPKASGRRRERHRALAIRLQRYQ